jgi:hypothetical protein
MAILLRFFDLIPVKYGELASALRLTQEIEKITCKEGKVTSPLKSAASELAVHDAAQTEYEMKQEEQRSACGRTRHRPRAPNRAVAKGTGHPKSSKPAIRREAPGSGRWGGNEGNIAFKETVLSISLFFLYEKGQRPLERAKKAHSDITGIAKDNPHRHRYRQPPNTISTQF